MFLETLRQALSAILRNAMRSFLTVLGVIIGVAAVIAMVTIGQGSTAQIESDVSSLGVNLLMMRPGQGMGPGSSSRTAPLFSLKDVAAIKEQVPGVLAAAPVNSSAQTVIAGNENHSATITGTDAEYLKVRSWKVEDGRAFLDAEVRAGSAVCLLGQTVRKELYGAGNPVGDKVRIGQISCRVIGVLEAKGASTFGQDQDNVVLMPVRTFMRRIGGSQDVASINIGVDSAASTSKVQSAIEVLMRERRRIQPGEEDDFSVLDTKELTSMMTGITTVMTGLLSSVAAVSLLVGGIGI
ncbi:MAG: ABC transporter permease, partial [Notoacmeibacter sp.]|nr:ABC transporter permease [Notoacmeibacter sp.]